MLLAGTIVMSRRVGPDDVEIVRTDQRGVYAGAMLSYLDDARDPDLHGDASAPSATSA